MFGKMMNNYYYGKSGKGDFRKEDLPKNRWQLFWEMLRVRLSSLCRLNLMTVVAWLPLMIVIINFVSSNLDYINIVASYRNYENTGAVTETFPQEAIDAIQMDYENYIATNVEINPDIANLTVSDFLNIGFWEHFENTLVSALFWLVPCIFITGPVQAGLAYITRNWARDEHAFIWSDFKDAVKANWKQGLGISAITSLMPLIIYTCYTFYGEQANENVIFVIPQMLTITLGIIWLLSTTFMYPIIISYKVKFKGVLKNGLMLSIARLPHTIVIRLAALIPALLCLLIFWLTGTIFALLALALYYVMIGFALTRFIIASFTNGIFDRYINSHIEGAKVNQGIAIEEDDDEDEEEENPTDNPPSLNA